MHVQLVLPGLIWPNQATTLTQGLALPALEKMLGYATLQHTGRRNLEDTLGELFGASEPLPVAALRHAGEADAAEHTRSDDAPHWLCADPVHLHFAREHLLLTDATDLNIRAEEADELVKTLNAFIAEEEPDLVGIQVMSPERWYLPLSREAETRFFPLSDVVGRPVSHFAPEGKKAHQWARLSNEIQVILHNHPVNHKRESEGLPTINSVWFWGAGQLPTLIPPPAKTMHTRNALARGLARHLGMTLHTADELPDHDAIVVIDDLLAPALRLDLERWRASLQQLEHSYFAPLLKQLRAGKLKQLRCIAPGDRLSLTFQLTPTATFKFWRRPRRLEDIIFTP